MITNFGKFLRKLRVDHNEFLKDMAARLGVTVAYLSAIEHGKHDVPDHWMHLLATIYDLTPEQITEMQTYAYENKDNIKIRLSHRTPKDRELILAFAQSINNLSETDKKDIYNILQKRRNP